MKSVIDIARECGATIASEKLAGITGWRVSFRDIAKLAAFAEWIRAERWIPVSEQLPKQGQDVLLTSLSWCRPEVMRFESNWKGGGPKFIESHCGAERAYWYPERMHWQPLPPPPAAIREPDQAGGEG